MQTETTEEEDPKKVGRVLKLCKIRYGGEGAGGEGPAGDCRRAWLAGGMAAWSSL